MALGKGVEPNGLWVGVGWSSREAAWVGEMPAVTTKFMGPIAADDLDGSDDAAYRDPGGRGGEFLPFEGIAVDGSGGVDEDPSASVSGDGAILEELDALEDLFCKRLLDAEGRRPLFGILDHS